MFNRWIILFIGIIVNLLLLLIIPEEHLIFRSISITFVSVSAISYYLYKRYSKRLSIQSDLLISLNTLVQFLLPVFYLIFYYETNPHLDIQGYRFGFPITSFAALLGQTMFFLGYENIKNSVYFPQIKITRPSYNSFFLVTWPLMFLAWGARLFLLSTGSYYMVYRTEYQFTSPHFSAFSQIGEFGLIIVGALFLIAFSEEKRSAKKKKIILATIFFLFELLWYLPSGQREILAYIVLAPIFAYIFIHRRIPKIIIVIIIIVSFPLLPILSSFRYVASTYFEQKKINLIAMPAALLAAQEHLGRRNIKIIPDTLDRLYDGKSLGYLLMHYANDYKFELGKTYSMIPFIFIPRSINPNKPVFTTALGGWYELVKSASQPTTFWGESYINFSWFGIIIMSFLLGLMMKAYDYLFIVRVSKPYWMFIYLFTAIHIARLPMEVVVIWISFLSKAIILAIILTSMHLILVKITSNNRTDFIPDNQQNMQSR